LRSSSTVPVSRRIRRRSGSATSRPVAGDRLIRTLGMAARFDSVLEVTLDELRIELLYPADEDAKEFVHAVPFRQSVRSEP
jgi:hypothetical protein